MSPVICCLYGAKKMKDDKNIEMVYNNENMKIKRGLTKGKLSI